MHAHHLTTPDPTAWQKVGHMLWAENVQQSTIQARFLLHFDDQNVLVAQNYRSTSVQRWHFPPHNNLDKDPIVFY